MRFRSSALYFAVAIAASAAALTLTFAAPSPFGGDVPASEAAPAPEFQNIDNWLNSQPLKLSELRGKVVLVDFWTYTCINCLNHLPYVKDWNQKYKDKGLVVVGVHTPEFAFEKSTKNVRTPSSACRSNTRLRRTTATAPGRPSGTSTGPPCT